MKKTGRYAAEVFGPPESYFSYCLGRLRQLVAAGRRLARCDWHEAVATATKAVAQSVGAYEVWRSGEYLGDPATGNSRATDRPMRSDVSNDRMTEDSMRRPS
jgi:hypothetical protein